MAAGEWVETASSWRQIRTFLEHYGNSSRSPRLSDRCMLWGHHRRGWDSVAVGFKRVEKSWLSLWRLQPIWPGRDGRFRVFSRVKIPETLPSGPSCCRFMYADDHQLYVTGSDYSIASSRLQYQGNLAMSWYRDNFLLANTDPREVSMSYYQSKKHWLR